MATGERGTRQRDFSGINQIEQVQVLYQVPLVKAPDCTSMIDYLPVGGVFSVVIFLDGFIIYGLVQDIKQ